MALFVRSILSRAHIGLCTVATATELSTRDHAEIYTQYTRKSLRCRPAEGLPRPACENICVTSRKIIPAGRTWRDVHRSAKRKTASENASTKSKINPSTATSVENLAINDYLSIVSLFHDFFVTLRAWAANDFHRLIGEKVESLRVYSGSL